MVTIKDQVTDAVTPPPKLAEATADDTKETPSWESNPVLVELSDIIVRSRHVVLDYPGSGMSTLAEANVEHTIRYVNKCLKGLKPVKKEGGGK